MSGGVLRFGNLAAAALAIGGLLVMALPQHGMSVLRLVIATLAAAAGLSALVTAVPVTWWSSPFEPGRPSRPEGSTPDELASTRSKLSGRRHRLEDGPPLPPQTVRVLRSLIRAALEREHLDPDDESGLAAARHLLSPLTWAVLTSDMSGRPHWMWTLRPDEREVAEVVHGVLDDLDRLADRRGGPPSLIANRHPGTP